MYRNDQFDSFEVSERLARV